VACGRPYRATFPPLKKKWICKVIRKICVVGVRINMGDRKENRNIRIGHRKGVRTKVLFHSEILWQLDSSRKGGAAALLGKFGICVV